MTDDPELVLSKLEDPAVFQEIVAGAADEGIIIVLGSLNILEPVSEPGPWEAELGVCPDQDLQG